MFHFAHLFAFAFLLPIAAGAWFIYRRTARKAVAFSAVSRIASTGTTWRTAASAILPALFLLGLVLMVLALARPQTVLSRVRRTSDVIAIQMAVDVSGSMEALDLSIRTPTGMNYRTRLDAVKETFADFVELRPDDLIGLITFGGYASTRCPLTADHKALLHVLSGVEIPKQSFDSEGRIANQEELLTAVGDALATACARLEHAEPKSKIVVLLSDGESNTGIIRPEQAIELARTLGIKVYTIGVGSTGRAPFWGRDLFGRKTIQHALVRMDEALLQSIATSTGGKYFNVKDPSGLEKAMEEIDQLEKTEVERDIYSHFHELFPWFLIPGLCLVVLGAGLNLIISKRIV